jgi:hypothetical protein
VKLAAISVLALSAIVLTSINAVHTPQNAVQIPELSEASLSSYDSVFSNAGYKVLGNNFFLNNETKELADVDSQELTTNSTAIGLPRKLEFSEAILVYAVNTTKLNVSDESSHILISRNGIEYNSKKMEAFGSKNGHTIGLTSLTASDFRAASNLYVSLPILEDTENYNRISMAGFYLILLDSSGDAITTFNMSFEKSDTAVSTGLSLGRGEIKGISEADKRMPNNGFTKIGEVIAGKSLSGNFGIHESGFLYLNSMETSIPRPVVSTSKFLAQSSDNPTDSFELEVSLPSSLSDSEFKITIDSNSNYVNNTSLIPAGRELSGPLTDAAGDDVFSYSNGVMSWHFNSGEYQLNKVNNTSLRFLINAPIFGVGIAPIIEYKTSGDTRRVKGNYLEFSYLDKWKDVALAGAVQPISKTSAEIRLSVLANSELGDSGTISFTLPQFTAILKQELDRNRCSASESNLISCKVNIKEGFTEIKLNILTRRELANISFPPILLELSGDYTDPNYNNNVVILKAMESDK